MALLCFHICQLEDFGCRHGLALKELKSICSKRHSLSSTGIPSLTIIVLSKDHVSWGSCLP